jgi:hypothetical protein
MVGSSKPKYVKVFEIANDCPYGRGKAFFIDFFSYCALITNNVDFNTILLFIVLIIKTGTNQHAYYKEYFFCDKSQ